MLRPLLISLSICVVLATGAAAEIWDTSMCTVSIDPTAEGAVVVVVPDGAGPGFADAYGPGGIRVDATITLTVNDLTGDPIPQFPAEDIWLATTEGGLVACDGGVTCDHDTDDNGQTVWREPPSAGGCSLDEMTEVYIMGMRVPGPGLPLVFKSPDLSGDLMVNLTDISLFTSLIGFAGESCADFTNDGMVDLADIVRMAQGIGATCN